MVDARGATLEQAEALLRAFQEGLTNAARDGAARELRVRLHREGSDIVLDLRDDGGGGREVRAGNGLAGMRERRQALGGELRFGRAGDGFHLQARLPA